MVELKIYLSDNLNEQFRRTAMNVYGYGRGSLSKAAEEALAEWCSAHDGSAVQSTPQVKTAPIEGSKSGVDPDERQGMAEKPAVLAKSDSLARTGPASE
jgi:hypothetical protein